VKNPPLLGPVTATAAEEQVVAHGYDEEAQATHEV